MERSSNRTPEAYKHLDRASATVLIFMTLWAPWAFGSATPRTLQILCAAAYLSGALLIGKWVVRKQTGYRPSRWSEPTPAGTRLIRILAGLNIAFLLYVVIGVFNARAVGEYIPAGENQGVNLNYVERTPIGWLPASYDAPVSWNAFWRWFGFSWVFWAARDWFLGKTRTERRETEVDAVVFPGQRLQWWLWTLSGSSFLLAAVCVIQRLDGTDKLLWLLTPRHPDPNSIWSYPTNFHFGPYNYRGNAAEYFNLVWPLVLGLWSFSREIERRRRGVDVRVGQGPHILLLPWTLVIGAAPIISGSRGGALITALLTLAVGLAYSVAPSRLSLTRRLLIFGGFIALLAGAIAIGGSVILGRLRNPEPDPYSNRLVVFRESLRMMQDFKWLGSGADTFATIQPFYKETLKETWTAYAHNDWMEAVITLGAVGTAMLVGILAIALILPKNQLRYGGGKTSLGMYFYLGLAGMLIHGLFDFPFQMASLQVEFLLVLAAFTTLVQRDSGTKT
jgi:hypothetical protein